MFPKKLILVILVGLGICFGQMPFSPLCQAMDYPTRNVDIIVPWGPGSNADMLARILAPQIGRAHV